MKNKINTFFIVAFVLTLSACAAKQTIPGAERVELVNDRKRPVKPPFQTRD